VQLSLDHTPGAMPGNCFELVTFGKGGPITSFDVDRVSAWIEQNDATCAAAKRRN